MNGDHAKPTAHSSDYHLLCGLIAYQNGFVEEKGLLAAIRTLLADRSASLLHVLEARGFLTRTSAQLLQELTEERLAQTGQDAQRCLSSLRSVEPIRQAIHRLGAPDWQAGIVRVPSFPVELPDSPRKVVLSSLIDDIDNAVYLALYDTDKLRLVRLPDTEAWRLHTRSNGVLLQSRATGKFLQALPAQYALAVFADEEHATPFRIDVPFGPTTFSAVFFGERYYMGVERSSIPPVRLYTSPPDDDSAMWDLNVGPIDTSAGC